MSGLFALLVFLTVILALIAVIGHAIWLVAAALLRWVTGTQPSWPPATSSRPISHESDASEPKLQQIRLQLERLRTHQLISDATFLEVLRALGRYEQASRSAAPGSPSVAPPATAVRPDVASDESGSVVTPAPPFVPAHLPATSVESERPVSPTPSVPSAPSSKPTDSAPPSLPVDQDAASLVERAKRYAKHRTQAAREGSAASIPSAETPARDVRAPWSRLFAAFLEEKNIRWGELVGGLLIVSCSIALVVSFWSAIAERPFLKFGVLNGVTASLFALGIYAASRWKLPTTSQGILITSTLLVPLNFLAIAAFSEAAGSVTLPMLAGELFSIGLFSTLVYFAAKWIVPDWPWSLTIGVMVPSICQLTVRRYVSSDTSLPLLYGFCLVGLATAVGVQSVGRRQWGGAEPIGERRGNEILKRLGLVLFALLVALGLLLVKTEQPRVTLQWLSPLSVLASLPILACGIALWLRPKAVLPNHRMAGAVLFVASLLVVIGGLVLAWPQPALIVGLCVCSSAMLLAAGIAFSIPAAHGVAILVLMPAVVLTIHVMSGHLGWINAHGPEVIEVLLSGFTGRVLTVCALVAFGVSVIVRWLRRIEWVRPYAWAGVVSASVGMVLVCIYGFGRVGDPEYVTLILGMYTAVAVVLALRVPSRWALAAGGGLLLGALLQLFMYTGYSWNLVDGRLVTPTVHALLMMAFAAWLTTRPVRIQTALHAPASAWTKITSVVSVLLIVIKMFEGTPLDEWSGLLLLTLLSLSVTWGGLAWIQTSAVWFAASQVALVLTGVVWIDLQVQRQPWFDESAWTRFYPQSLQWQAIGGAAFALVWMVIRRWLGTESATADGTLAGGTHADGTHADGTHADGAHADGIRASGTESRLRKKLRDISSVGGVRVDAAVAFIAGVVLVALAVYGVVPGIGQELTLRASAERVVPAIDTFLWQGIPHVDAHGWATWVLAMMLATLCIGLIGRRRSNLPLSELAVVSSTLPVLIASRWEATVAVASALRWSVAIYFLMASILVWAVRPIERWGQRWGIVGTGDAVDRRMGTFHSLLFVSLSPMVGMLAFVGVMALRVESLGSNDIRAIYWTALIALFGIVGLFVASRGARQNHMKSESVQWVLPAAYSSLVLALSPFLAVTLFVVGNSLASHPVIGPDPSAWFARIGLAASYSIPLFIASVAIIGHAINCRSHGIAFAAGLSINASVTAAYLLTLKTGSLSADQWIRLSQVNAMVSALFGTAWYWVAAMLRRVDLQSASEANNVRVQAVKDPQPFLLRVQRGIASGFALLPIAAAMIALLAGFERELTIQNAANVWGWLALIGFVAFWLVSTRHEWSWRTHQLAVWAASAALVMLALDSHGWRIGGFTGTALSLRAMQIALMLSAILVAIAERWGRAGWVVDTSQPRSLSKSGVRFEYTGTWPLFGLIAYTLATLIQHVQGLGSPEAWGIAGFFAAAAISVDRGWMLGRQRWWFFAAMLFNVAASFWWAEYGAEWIGGRPLRGADEFVCGNVIALAGLVPFWIILTRRRMPFDHGMRAIRRMPTVQGVAIGISISLMLILVRSSLFGEGNVIHPFLAWGAVLVTAIACISSLWDTRMKWSGVACYIAGLLVIGTFFGRLNLPASDLLWSSTLMLSVHGVASSYVWSRRAGILTALERFGVVRPSSTDGADHEGFVELNRLLAIVVCGLAAVVQLSESNQALRLAASQAVAAQVLAIGLLADGRRATGLRYFALAIGVVSAVLFGWSWLVPNSFWLNRAVVTACALMVMAVFYAIGLIKLIRRDNDWTLAARRFVPPLIAAGTLSVLGVLIAEVSYFVSRGSVPIGWPATLAIAIAIGVSAAASLVAAIVPGRDPLGLSERQRMGYVYAAEVLLAVLAAHLRVCVPELFSGVFQQYWTLVVIGLAFLGVGLGEFFRRRRQNILAEPLERTGVIMPLLPILGFWVGTGDVHLSLVMFAAGALYASLSVMRRSFGFGVLAALAANGGFWYFLQTTASIQFFAHPQLWLIPPAVCVLIAAYLNRANLDASQMTSIRYLTSTVIYASSTADIFINGVAEAPWLPFVLAALALTGIFAGIMMRVRAFLFLGIAFLAIALFTVIWHAAVDLQQTWLWYVSGIIVGVLIIAMFALFERKRKDVLDVVEQLKAWER